MLQNTELLETPLRFYFPKFSWGISPTSGLHMSYKGTYSTLCFLLIRFHQDDVISVVDQWVS